MRKAVLGSIAAITAGAGWASAQSPRMPTAVMPAPVSVAPGGVMQASMDSGMAMPPDAQPMMAGGGAMGGPMMPPGPFPGDMGMGGPPMGGGSGGSPVDNSSRLASKFEFNGRTLLYFVKAQPSPGALITTSAPGANGFIGQPSTQVLYGNGDLGMGLFSGFDLSGTLWKDPDRRIGFHLGGTLLEQKSNGFNNFSDTTGSPLLARPFTNALTGLPDSLLVSFPNALAGGVIASATTKLYGADGGFMWNLYRSCPGNCTLYTLNWYTGFKYLELNEKLDVTQTSILINGFQAPFNQQLFATPAAITVRDSIQGLNSFYGGQVGLSADIRYGRVFIGLEGKLGMGVMHQRLDIEGVSTVRDPNSGANASVRGGLLANANNSGRFLNDEFSLLPEASATIGYNWTSWFTTTVGYGFMYMNNVIRPGDQVNSTVNSSLVPAHPGFGGGVAAVPNRAFTQSDFWAQGVQIGFVFRW